MEATQSIEQLHQQLADKEREQVRTKTGMKHRAQDLLLHGIAVAKGYWDEQHATLYDAMTPEQRKEFDEILQQQADRVAKLFGYEQAWSA